MNPGLSISVLLMLFLAVQSCWSADTVPADVQQPGTQPLEIDALAPPSNCVKCHNPSDNTGMVAPSPSWSGSPMAHAGRDPIFWASMAIAEQDFDGSGDLCLRCHSTSGWLAGRSTPTDGSALQSPEDADGVDCEFCHKMTPPNDSDPNLLGAQNAPFLANDLGDPVSDPSDVLSYLGTGMASLWADADRLGPYQTPADANPSHGAWFSSFYRSVDYCGTCHDVSNPVVGNLAHNNGAQATGDPVYTNTTDPSGTGPGQLGGKVDDKAAFNNQPYKYGVIERTFSEYKASLLPKTLVSDYSNLPTDLQAGAIKAARDAALLAGQGGNYADGTPRYFSCQTCHMSAAVGRGAKQNKAPLRHDLPVHDLTGGNYWVGPTIKYLDSQSPSKLRLGTGLTPTQVTELDAAADRARLQLNLAASLKVDGNSLTVTNLTGHKLITGYPEGRRMWLNIRWYDAADGLLREDGAYGPLVDGKGSPVLVTDPVTDAQVQVHSLLNLNDVNSKVYEAHYGMTHEWAEQLSDLGSPDDMVLAYDRLTGIPTLTLGELEGKPDGTKAETFHFVLNNVVLKDNRIPPHGMDREEARKRNILPVPATQYGGGLSGSYNYWDEVQINPPVGADHAQIELKYQPTSWEYVQFLYLANDGSKTFLQNEGQNLLEAWIHTGMAEPHVMASTSWSNGGVQPGVLQFSPATYSVDENGGSVTVSVTRTGGSDGAASVSYGTADGSATAGSDYTSTSGELNWTDGNSDTKTFEVAIADDAVVEDDEEFNVNLSGEAGASLGSPSSAAVTIQDDDVAPSGVLQFSSATYSVNENAGSVTVSVTRTGGSNGAASVSYATADGSATAGSDYTSTSGELNWANGDSATKTFEVAIADDAVVEGNEVFTIDLSGETGASLGSPTSTSVTILDDEVAQPGVLQFGSATYSVGENAGSVTVFVTRTGGSGGAASVSYATADDSATAGSDYTSTSSELNWVDGDSTKKSFAVTINNDAIVESDEEFTVDLSDETGASLGSQTSASVTIVNNCDGDGKVADLDGGEFKESDPVTCQTSVSISARRVTVQPQAHVTFISQSINLGAKFSIKPQGTFRAKSAP